MTKEELTKLSDEQLFDYYKQLNERLIDVIDEMEKRHPEKEEK